MILDMIPQLPGYISQFIKQNNAYITEERKTPKENSMRE
jgi:hypothetical protein